MWPHMWRGEIPKFNSSYCGEISLIHIQSYISYQAEVLESFRHMNICIYSFTYITCMLLHMWAAHVAGIG